MKEENTWISAEVEPLIIKQGKHWQTTENGSKMFLAALQVHDNRDNSTSWWVRLCVIEDEIGLCVVGDDDNEPAGWEIEDIQYYKIVNTPDTLLNIDKAVQECDASKAKSTDEPM